MILTVGRGRAAGAAERATLSPAIVLASIIGFWLFFIALGTIRAFAFYPLDDQLHLLRLRLEVGAGSVVITAALYVVLSRFATRRLPARIAVAAGACVAAAAGFALLNAALYHGMPMTPSPVPAGGAIALPSMPSTCEVETWSDLVAEHSITGYFLMAAWAALYLALGYAAEVAAWERQAADLRAAAQTAELRALRFQINPHFLFNTLNSLSALVIGGLTREAEEVIAGLSAFFRASLTGDPTQDVTLADEIALQRLYLDIEQRRFPGRLSVAIDCFVDEINVSTLPTPNHPEATAGDRRGFRQGVPDTGSRRLPRRHQIGAARQRVHTRKLVRDPRIGPRRRRGAGLYSTSQPQPHAGLQAATRGDRRGEGRRAPRAA